MAWSNSRRQGWIDKTSGHGFGECQCPFTGWRFHESWVPDPARRKLRRRLWTTQDDHLHHDIVAERAAEVEAAQRLINETGERRDLP
jgi:hypothetical protein